MKEKEIKLNNSNYIMELKEISDLLTRIDERQQAHDELLKAINEQVKKTNGRVTKVEEYRELVAEPCIQRAELRYKETREQIQSLCKFKDDMISSGRTTKYIVTLLGGVVIAASIAFYNFWVKDLSESISANVMTKIEETYYFN